MRGQGPVTSRRRGAKNFLMSTDGSKGLNALERGPVEIESLSKGCFRSGKCSARHWSRPLVSRAADAQANLRFFW